MPINAPGALQQQPLIAQLGEQGPLIIAGLIQEKLPRAIGQQPPG